MIKLINFFLIFFLINCHSNEICKETFYNQNLEKEPIIIQAWKQKPIGNQIFKYDSEKIKYKMFWNINKNIWKFDYKKFIITIKSNKIFKYQNNKTSQYPCIGINKIFITPINKWLTLMKLEKEIINGNECVSVFKFNRSYIVIKFIIKPFALQNIIFVENNKEVNLNFLI